MNVRIAVKGIQGHAAYPSLSLNPIPIMAELIARLSTWKLDEGREHFEPSTLAFTTVDVGNPAVNVTPAQALAGFNIRFNDLHTPDSLWTHIEETAADVKHRLGGEVELVRSVSGVSFLTRPGEFTGLLSKAVARVTGAPPELSTTGGTSDARFIKDYCPVLEFGLVGQTMHQMDECAPVADLATLTAIYRRIIDRYFA
jgi:succinyl-diaminopimelate desuccinylase